MNSEAPVEHVVIIGNGMAGAVAAEEILALRPGLKITMFGDEPHVNYNRILLSDVLAGKRGYADIILNSNEWYDTNGIDLRVRTKVTAIDADNRTVTDGGGRVTPFDRLVLAVGGSAFIPPIQGADKTGVFTFRSLEDCEKILTRSRSAERAVVVGGGLLGLEAARGMINHGVSVTVVHLMDRLMELQLDGVAGALLKREMERVGIEVLLNTTVTEILGDGRAAGVRLKTGDVLPAEMVLICTGIRPNVDLAKAANLKTNRGIVVNDAMQTSHPDIYAIGDAIEHRGKVYGFIAPHREQARALADSMVGSSKLGYRGTICATVLKVAGIDLTSAGEFMGGPGSEDLVFVDSAKGMYRKIVLQRKRVVGMILLGSAKYGQDIFQFIKSGEDVSGKMDKIISMVHEPPGAKDAASCVSSTLAMAETDQVCNCNTVSKGTIVKSIREKGLKTREDVARCTKASTGCGSCAALVESILKETLGQTATPLAVCSAPPTSARIAAGDVPIHYPRVFEAERIKQEGLGLDWEKIREKGVFALTEDDYYRLKGYGVCSQKHPGYFMLRIRIPGGKATCRQLLALADVAELYGRGWGHLTTRQDMELHWVRVEDAPKIWDTLDRAGITTRSSCGHTLRNVAACPNSAVCEGSLLDVEPWAKSISDYFVKRSDLINPKMPNRLNIYFAGCPECAPEAQINDIAFVPVQGAAGIGFEVWVGGSLGTNPHRGYKMRDFVEPADVLPVCQTVFEIHTKHGMRTKGRSRLKFLIEAWGIEKFTAEFNKVFAGKRALPENREFRIPGANDCEPGPTRIAQAWTRLLSRTAPLPDGCFAQRQKGYVRVALDITLGEIRPDQLREVAEMARRYGNKEVRFTKDQDIEFHWIQARHVDRMARELKAAGLVLKGKKTNLRVTACVGTEFCIYAATNSQGAAREILNRMAPVDPKKAELLRGLTISLSGCPNSCAKQQVADIGLVGQLAAVGDERRFSYNLSICGAVEKDKGRISIGEVVRKKITEEMVVPALDALLAVILDLRRDGESFRETVGRAGFKDIEKELERRPAPPASKAGKKVVLKPELVEIG